MSPSEGGGDGKLMLHKIISCSLYVLSYNLHLSMMLRPVFRCGHHLDSDCSSCCSSCHCHFGGAGGTTSCGETTPKSQSQVHCAVQYIENQQRFTWLCTCSHQRSATISANAESNSYESPYVTVRHTQQQWNLKQPNDYEVPVSSAQSKTEFLGMREAGQPYDYEVPVCSVQQTVCQGSAIQHEYAIPIVKSSQRTPQASQRQENIRHGGQASLPTYVTQKSATMAIPIVNNPSTGRTQPAIQPSPDDGRLLSSSALFIETASL